MLQILIRLVLLFLLWSLIRILYRAFFDAAGRGTDSGRRRSGAGGRGAGGHGDGFGGSSGSRYRTGRSSGRRLRRRREALDVLGLSEGASAEEVKRSYRALARKYHPDRVASRAPELSDLASEKFREVRDAYEYLMSHGTGRTA